MLDDGLQELRNMLASIKPPRGAVEKRFLDESSWKLIDSKVHDSVLYPENLDESQRAAMEALKKWLTAPTLEKRVFTVGGLAGSGKTTMVKTFISVVEALQIEYGVVAFMAKVVDNLRVKGVPKAQTLHSLQYLVKEAEGEKELLFEKRQYLTEKLIVVDEGSTISENLHKDLLSFPDLRIVYFGDHGQLPPIEGNLNVMENPDVVLTGNHRQGEGSPIIEFAKHLRNGGGFRYGQTEHVSIFPRANMKALLPQREVDIVLVGENVLRHELNQLLRRRKGFGGIGPCVGENIILLDSLDSRNLFHGRILRVTRVVSVGNYFVLDLIDPTTQEKWDEVPVFQEFFGKDKPENFPHWLRDARNKGILMADFAQAITGYKAIGSEFDKVAVVEPFTRRSTYRRYAYTMATRARKYLDWYA